MVNRKINIDRPATSSEEISAMKDFNNVLAGYNNVYNPFYKSSWFFSSILIVAVVSGVTYFFTVHDFGAEKKSDINALQSSNRTSEAGENVLESSSYKNEQVVSLVTKKSEKFDLTEKKKVVENNNLSADEGSNNVTSQKIIDNEFEISKTIDSQPTESINLNLVIEKKNDSTSTLPVISENILKSGADLQKENPEPNDSSKSSSFSKIQIGFISSPFGWVGLHNYNQEQAMNGTSTPFGGLVIEGGDTTTNIPTYDTRPVNSKDRIVSAPSTFTYIGKAGISFNYNLNVLHHKLSLQTELLLDRYKQNYHDFGHYWGAKPSIISTEKRLTYISVPVIFSYISSNKKRVTCYFEIGPQFSYLISAQGQYIQFFLQKNTYKVGFSEPLEVAKSHFTKLNLSGVAGIGTSIRISEKISMTAGGRLTFGITDILSKEGGRGEDYPYVGYPSTKRYKPTKTESFNFMVGVRYSIN